MGFSELSNGSVISKKTRDIFGEMDGCKILEKTDSAQ